MKNTNKRPLSYYLGTFLMISALSVLFYVYLPIINLYIFPAKEVSPPENTYAFTITIPKIGAQAPVIENVDPFNEEEYQNKLKKGVAHAKGFSVPGRPGPVFLFSHSSDYPWNITRYNTAFFRLNEVTYNDKIIITYQGRTYTYTVKDIREVDPTAVEQVTKSQYGLVLQTCTPIGTDWKRLLVFADVN